MSAITPPITDHDGADYLAWDGSRLSTAGFGWVILEVTAIVGAVAIYGSVVGTPVLIAVQNMGDVTSTPITSITAVGLYAVPAAGVLTAVIGTSATMNVKWKT